MERKFSFKLDIPALQEQLTGQFRNLDPNDPSRWPVFPRYALFLVVIVALVVALWFLWLNTSEAELEVEQTKEVTLREEYKKKLGKAVNLEALKKQREQIQQYVIQLEKQLPSKAEMAALLSDINQAGLGRGLLFESFKPGQVQIRDYYAELPIALKVTGKYHDIGAFAADIANLSRIVTLHDMNLTAQTAGKEAGRNAATVVLTLEANARTYRYLDPNESSSQEAKRKEAAKGPRSE